MAETAEEEQTRLFVEGIEGRWIERCHAEQRGVSQTLLGEAVAVELVPPRWQPPTGLEVIEQRELYALLCEGLSVLCFRSWLLLLERYGLRGQPQTLDQLAQARGVARPTIARWLVRAHQQLGQAMRRL